MNIENQSSLIVFLQVVEPFITTVATKKEIEMLVEILDTLQVDSLVGLKKALSNMQKNEKELGELLDVFQVATLTDLKKTVLKQQKELNQLKKDNRNSPDNIATRAIAYRNAKANLLTPDESSQQIGYDLEQLAATKIKQVGKTLGINIAKKADIVYFLEWLETGKEPPIPSSPGRPTKASLRKEYVSAAVTEAVQIRDQDLSVLTKDSFDKIIEIAENVYAQYKLDGLREFATTLGMCSASGSKKSEIITQLKSALDELVVSRSKINDELVNSNPYFNLL